MWALYIVSVILAWLSGRYLTSQDIKTRSTIEGGIACIIVPFIPVINLIIIATAISDMIIKKPKCVTDVILKFYMVKDPKAVKDDEPESKPEKPKGHGGPGTGTYEAG